MAKKEWKGRQLLPQLQLQFQLQLPFPFAVKASLGTETVRQTDGRTNRSTADSFVCARVDHSSKVQNKPLTNGTGQSRQPGSKRRPTTAPAQVASNNNSNIDFGFGLAAAAATGAAFKAVFGLAS